MNWEKWFLLILMTWKSSTFSHILSTLKMNSTSVTPSIFSQIIKNMMHTTMFTGTMEIPITHLLIMSNQLGMDPPTMHNQSAMKDTISM